MGTKVTADKRVKKTYCCYVAIRNANVIFNLRRILMDSGAKRWLFIVIPIIAYSLNLFLIMKDNAFWCEDPDYLSYAKDMSNSVALTILFFVSYYLSYYFPSLFDKWINIGIISPFKLELAKGCNGTRHPNGKGAVCSQILNGIKRVLLFFLKWLLLPIVGTALGVGFAMAAANGNAPIWTNALGTFSKLYYYAYLSLTWYLSLSVLVMALIGGFVIFWSLKAKVIEFKLFDYNHNLSIVYAVDVLLCTFSYGLLYIVGSFIFILTDNKWGKADTNIQSVFSEDIPALILIVVILVLVAVAYVPLQELMNFMRGAKIELVNEYNKRIEEADGEKKEQLVQRRNQIIETPLILTSISNRIMLTSSIVIPLVGVILQAIPVIGPLFNS